MSDNLQQLNITYIPKEDRLLFRVRAGSNTEFRIWFTRRYTNLLMKLLTENMQKFGGAETIAVSNETQKSIQQGALEKKYQEPQAPDYPFGENGFIAYQLKIASDKDNNLHLQLLPEKGKGMNLKLDKKILFMLHNLLFQGINRANWKLSYDDYLPTEIH
ncbi:MAG: hypothetical protein COA71_06605 [SAR86 cluster bacterium]|uniref:Uncharacterized protein n=1 Tax=SAR86 cluster bacterium TaxID=2030880 RepID=A0A2A5CDY6_9GAMM|nr:hypothetical protein [Gammaproteobacteria bacterium AH-315-E17]PCJ41680.1 MAG: hypothetical protein COA71_06605 [SAR86 cluster bacterium]